MNKSSINIGIISSYPNIKDSISEYITDFNRALRTDTTHRFRFHYFPVQMTYFSKLPKHIWDIKTAPGLVHLLQQINNSNLDIVHLHYGTTFLGFPRQLDLIQHINFYLFLKNIHKPVVITAHMYFENELIHWRIVRNFFTKKILAHIIIYTNNSIAFIYKKFHGF